MAAINHTVTDDELNTFFKDILTLFDNDPTMDDDTRIRTANDYVYSVFRGIITPESLRAWITNRTVNNATG